MDCIDLFAVGVKADNIVVCHDPIHRILNILVNNLDSPENTLTTDDHSWSLSFRQTFEGVAEVLHNIDPSSDRENQPLVNSAEEVQAASPSISAPARLKVSRPAWTDKTLLPCICPAPR